MKRTYSFSGGQLALFGLALFAVAGITAYLATYTAASARLQCSPLPDADFGIEPVRSAGLATASIHPAHETLQ